MNHIELAESLVGTAYTEEYGCAELVREYILRSEGIKIPLASDREWRGKEPDWIAAFGQGFAAKLVGAYHPVAESGHIALMEFVGNQVSLGSHIGIIVRRIDGELWILHNLRDKGVVFHPERHLADYGLEVKGVYRVLNPSAWTAGPTPSQASSGT